MTAKLLLTTDEAAEALGVGKTKLYELLGRGELPSLKIGRRRMVPMRAIEDFVERLMAEEDGSDAQ